MAEKTPKDLSSNVINISLRRNVHFFINLARNFLKTHEEIEVNGLGDAMVGVAKVAETLVNQKYVTIQSLETSSIDLKYDNGSVVKKTKLKAVLKRSPDFQQQIESYQKNNASEDLLHPKDI